MFDALEGTIDHTLERARAADRRRAIELCEQKARLDQELMTISRRAGERGDWQAAGCSSGEQWLAQITSSDYQAAKRLTKTATALGQLPALDAALSRGELTLDQVAAAAPFATRETDAEIARIAVGKAPGQIATVARALVPPKVADDQELHRRRECRMTWTEGGRMLRVSARLPLEQGVVFEGAIRSLAKAQRAEDKQHGIVLDWQQSAADALVTLATHTGGGGGGDGLRRSRHMVILHLSADEPPFLEGAGPVSPETAECIACDAPQMTIKPHGRDLMHSPVRRCASSAQMRALIKRSKHCQYPGCSSAREFRAHHMLDDNNGGKAELANFNLLCSHHHTYIHDHHIQASGDATAPVFKDANGRVITAHQPHAPPR